MCGRAVLADPGKIRGWFDVDEMPAELAPHYNVAPSQVLAVIRTPRRLELLKWGIVRKERRAPQINVRVESIARTVRTQRRCLVVVDGFYEWRKDDRQPFLIREPDARPFALGGIWSSGATKDGEVVETVAIVTCPPRPPVDAIHDRMPLVIPREAYARWIDHGADVSDLLAVKETDLVAMPVSARVNAPANDDASLIEPVAVAQARLW